MSQENVENVRRGIDAWNRGDLDEWLGGFAPEAELHTTGRFADQGVYRGRAGLQRYWTEIREDVEEMSLSISDLRAIGDRVFFAVTSRARGKRSKVPVERPIWFITTLRNGLAVRVETYVDPTEALEAAGLRE
jgi:ketosteroid isomerase-like protein